MPTKGFSGSNKQTKNNVANLGKPVFGNQSKYQETNSPAKKKALKK